MAKILKEIKEAIRSAPKEYWESFFEELIREQQAKVDENIDPQELTLIPSRVTMLRKVKNIFTTINNET